MNSAAMKFIPLEDMASAGYGEWINEVRLKADMAG